MEDEKIDLRWGTFCTQLAASVGALACSVFASIWILTPNPIYSALIDACCSQTAERALPDR